MFFGQGKNKTDSPPPPTAGVAPAAAIFEAGTHDFEELVLRASMTQPVIAYFTAPWCGPCKQLGPILERVVTATAGAVRMARINVDSAQELAAALRIQSVPTIYMFFQGRPVDGFQGAVPESQVKVFVDKALQLARQAQPDALDIPEALKMAAQALTVPDFDAAQDIYMQVLQQDPKNALAYAGLIRVFIATGHLEQAQAMIEDAPEEIRTQSSFKEAQTALELATMKPAGPLQDLLDAVQKNPADHQARYDLALAQFAGGQKQEAADNLLEIIAKSPKWNEEQARKQLLKFFEALGHGDPITIESRRRLSSILFS
jgi:putative thioredoxin